MCLCIYLHVNIYIHMHIILVVLICTLIANQHIHKIYLWLVAITISCCNFFASGLCVTVPK